MTDQASPNPFDPDFKLRERHPDFQDYFDRNEKLSEQIRSAYPHTLDQVYGNHPLQTIDLVPATEPDSPIFVFIHGGFWRSLDKRSYHFTAQPFLEQGFAAAHVNYRLAPEVSMAEIVSDIIASINWIQQNANLLNGSPEKLHLAGHSAGGHLALLAAILREKSAETNQAALKSVFCISGLFDLEPITKSYLHEELSFDEATVRDYSPLKLRDWRLSPPITFAVGGAETNEFLRQSRNMHERLAASGHPSFHLVLPEFNHFDIVYELGGAGGRIAQAALEAMGKG